MRLLLSLALLLACATSLAQPITVSNVSTGGGGAFSGGTDGSFQSNTSATHTVSDGAYSFNLRGDVTAQFNGTADYFGFQAAAFFTLTTGAAPVQLSDLSIAYNGKEVPSGGSTATYTATQFYRAMLYVPGFGEDAFYATYLPDRTTQGVYVVDESHALAGTILAANTAYQLYLDVYPIVRLSSYPPGSSMLGYALEYGGDVSPQFDGLSFSFSAAAVPEPSALWLFAAGALLLAGRRFRASS